MCRSLQLESEQDEIGRPLLLMLLEIGTLIVGRMLRGFGIIGGGGAAVDNLLNIDVLREEEGPRSV